MINDTLARLKLKRRLACMLRVMENLGENSMGLLPYEEACCFHKITDELRAFIATSEHNHD